MAGSALALKDPGKVNRHRQVQTHHLFKSHARAKSKLWVSGTIAARPPQARQDIRVHKDSAPTDHARPNAPEKLHTYAHALADMVIPPIILEERVDTLGGWIDWDRAQAAPHQITLARSGVAKLKQVQPTAASGSAVRLVTLIDAKANLQNRQGTRPWPAASAGDMYQSEEPLRRKRPPTQCRGSMWMSRRRAFSRLRPPRVWS